MSDTFRSLAMLLALSLSVQGPVPAAAEPVPAHFTVAQLIKKLEARFPEIASGKGSLLSDDALQSDLLRSTNPSAVLETLGPPEAVRRFTYAYDTVASGELQQNRQWAGMIIRNALPGWRKGKAWTRRALAQAEKTPGIEPAVQEVEGYRVVVSNPDGRATLEVMPLAAAAAEATSLGIELSQVLRGLDEAFPERDEGMGGLFSGPGSVSDRFFSDNAHAALETLMGPNEDVIGLRYVYALRDDHAAATADNRRYAVTLVRNVFPDWAEAEAWMSATIDRVAQKADPGAEHSIIDLGPIRLGVRYFVGSTASIEVLIHPSNIFI